MDKRQISNLNATRSVLVVLDRWKDSIPEAAQECQQELIELAETIAQNGRQQKSKQGLTAQKTQCKKDLGEAAVTLAGALCSYGTSITDDRLVAACGFSRTKLLAGADSEVVARCSDLHDEAATVVDKLAKFKVTAATLKAFKTKIEAFDEVHPSPRDGIAKGAAATRRLPTLFQTVRVLLTRRLDPLIAPFKETEPALFNEYTVARKLVNAATTAEEEATIVLSVPGITTPQAKAA